jgi:cyclopropane fatty-acyl-phospholipid synthase-like methyltransferase
MNPQKRSNSSFESLYDLANEESQLSWHSEDIPLFLKKAVESLNGKGKVLDIGCGTGVYSVFMAQTGLEVTALDFVSRALDLARMRADNYGVKINFVQADLLEWETASRYDLIFDRGCLHSLGTKWRVRISYKEQILKWMLNDSSYILVHFGKKHFFNFRPGGPAFRSPAEIERFFSPELKLKEYSQEGNKRGTLIHYWFELKSKVL